MECRISDDSPFGKALLGHTVGEIVEVEASIGFAADRGIARLFDPALAGGALLDAGCYAVSFAVGVAAWARAARGIHTDRRECDGRDR